MSAFSQRALQRLLFASLLPALAACQATRLTGQAPSQTRAQARPEAATTAATAATGQLLFYSDRSDKRNQIFVMGLDGTGLRPLTTGPAASYHPAWSPDGSQLALVAQQGQQQSLFLMPVSAAPQNPAESLKGLSNGILSPTARFQPLGPEGPLRSPGQGDDPDWSPDGAELAFESSRSGHDQIYVCRADGSQLRQLTRQAASRFPRWSPDGSRILFLSARDGGGQDIWVMQRDGSQARNLTAGQASSFYPRWSPDGRQVLFLSQENQHQSLYVMASDGSGRRRLSEQPGVLTPAWSPDGKQIAYIVPDPLPSEGDSAPARDPAQALMLIDAAGGTPRTLSKEAGNLRPIWSPDGKWLIFQSTRDGNPEIYRIGVDGKGLSNLSRHPGADTPAGLR